MRQVFSNGKECCHIWASQSQESGRSGNIFFEGSTIYSYGHHFPIARFVSPNIVLLTTRGFSNSTAKHISYVHRAIPLNCRIIRVDNIRAGESSSPRDNKAAHQHNIDELYSDLRKLCETQQKARRFDYLGSIRSKLDDIRAYTNLVKLGRTKKLAELYSQRNNPQLWGIYLGLSPEEIEKAGRSRARFGEQQAIAKEKRNAERLAEMAAMRPALEQAWRTRQTHFANPEGGQSYVGMYAHQLPTMLRLSTDGKCVETSHGAIVSLDEAKRVLPLIRRRESVHHIGPYHGDGYSNGDIVIGCHKIPIAEIERLATELGL